MANMGLLAGGNYPGVATDHTAQYPRADRGDYCGQETGTHSDFLATGLRQSDGLIWDSLSVDMGKTRRHRPKPRFSLRRGDRILFAD